MAEEKKTSAPKKKRRWTRRLLYALIAIPILVVGMRVAVHEIPGFGPWVANTLRSLFGNEFVAWLEDTVYGVEDRVNQVTKADDAPTAQELRLRSSELLAAFASAPGGQRLRELQVVVRPAPKGDSGKPR